MTAVFGYPGKSLAKAVDGAMVAFQTHSPPGNFSNFEEAPEWLVIIDGARERFGKMHYEVSKNIRVPGLVTEELTMSTTREGLAKLAHGSSVRMRVGDIECTLTPEQLIEFKKFVDKMIEGLGDVTQILEVTDWAYKTTQIGSSIVSVRGTVRVRNPTNADIDTAQAVMTCSTQSGAIFRGTRYLLTIPPRATTEAEIVADTNDSVAKCVVAFESLLDHKPIKTVYLSK